MRTASPQNIPALLEHWVSAGIITAEQAERMRADVPATLATEDRAGTVGRATSLVTEAMGYLGGVIILVASGLVTGWFWSDMSTVVRLVLAAGVTVLLLVAGASVSRQLGAPGDRLRSVLWLLGSAGLAAFLGLAADEAFGWNGESVALFAAAGTAIVSAVLWYLHRRLPQHAATFVALAVTVATATSLLPGGPEPLPLAAIWGLGAVWGVLGWGGVLWQPQQGMIFGAVALVFASAALVGEDWGIALALVTVSALVLLAVLFRDLVLLAVASIGALITLPATMSRLFPGMISAALALLAVGVLLVAAAIVTARRRRERPATAVGRDWQRGDRRVALAVAALVAIVTLVAIIIAGTVVSSDVVPPPGV